MTKVGAVSGLALLAVGAAAVDMAMKYQSSTTRLVTSAGESSANIDMVRKGMLDMAGQVGFSATELSTGMYTVESAGFHAADGLTVLKASAQGAKDENADLAKVANAVTDVLTDYHLKASDAADVTSQMVEAVSFGKTSFDEFSGSMHNILPLASAMHLSFADVSGVLAEMTAHGMSADQASQNMADAMRHLIGPTGAQTKEFQALGINADMVREKMGTVGLAGTMEFLAETAKKVGPNVLDQEAALKKLMGTAPGLSVALMTTGENFEATSAAIKGISAASADAQGNVKGFAEMQETLGQRVAELKAGFDTLMIELGNKLIPAISATVDWMNRHHDVVVDVIGAVAALAAGVALYTAAVKVAEIATAAWKGAQVALTVATEAATAAMKAMPLAAVLAGAALLGQELGKLAGVGDHTAMSVDKLNTAMLGISSSGPQAQQQMAQLGIQMGLMSQMTGGSVQGMRDYDQSLANLVSSGHAADAAAIVAQIAAATNEHGKFLVDVTKDYPAYRAAVDAAANAAKSKATAVDTMTDSDKAATDAQADLTTSVAEATSQYDTAKKAATGYKDTIDALFGKYGDYSDAQAKLTLAMSDAVGTITRGKDAINLNTKAGAANFEALKGLADANTNLAQNMLKTGSDADQATAALRGGATAIDNLAAKSGFTKQQVADLNTALYGVPLVKNIKLSADTTSALNNIAALNNALNNVAAAMQVVHVKGTRVTAYAHGGEVSAAASGGIRGGDVLVGEEGAEIVRLPTGSTVRSHPDTVADLARGGGSGGGGPSSLEWIGPVGDELFTMIKRWIRVNYGGGPNSVQTALG